MRSGLMRLGGVLALLLVGCGDQGDGVPVLDETGRDGAIEVAVDDASTCPPGQSPCAGRCIDLRSDLLNCGACGAMCASTDTCNGGLCVPSASPLQ